jgi:hypothetical protein
MEKEKWVCERFLEDIVIGGVRKRVRF